MWPRVFTFLILLFSKEVFCEFGIVVVENENDSKEFLCSSFAITHEGYSLTSKDAVTYPLVAASTWDVCNLEGTETNFDNIASSVVLVNSNNNCSLFDQALTLASLNAAGLIIVDSNLPSLGIILQNSSFIIAIIKQESWEIIERLSPPLKVKFFVPPKKFYFDFAYLVMWTIALTAIVCGAIWSKSMRSKVEKGFGESGPIPMNEMASEEPERMPSQPPRTRTVVCVVGIYIAWATFFFSYILLNYYFFQYMIYVNIGFFCVAATISLYWCFLPFIRRLPMGAHKLRYVCCNSLEVRESIWCIICVAISIVWCICLRKSWVWIIQNFLGMAVCVALLGSWRIKTLKACTSTLVILFLYDIFMVFITPFFTKDGKSVMEKMVVGGSEKSDDLLIVPSVFQCPFLSTSPMQLCYNGYLILGFGDVIVPGILISYCYDFAEKNKSSLIYYISTIIGYCFGLLLTGIFVNVMNVSQPALLYLVPCCLVPVLIIAALRKEFFNLWNNHPLGYKLFNQEDDSTIEESSFIQNF